MMWTRRHLGLVALLLGVVSVGLPLLAFAGFREPVGIPFDDPAHTAYYRSVSLTLIAGAVLGFAAILLAGWSKGALIRGAGMGLGGLGLFASAALLLVFVGLCGPGVLWGSCSP